MNTQCKTVAPHTNVYQAVPSYAIEQLTIILQARMGSESIAAEWAIHSVQVAYCLDLFAQEVGFFLKSEALESLLEERMFLCLTNRLSLFSVAINNS